MKFIKLQCNTFRPDPKPEPTQKKKKKEIPKVSKKRIPLNAEYGFNRKEFLLLPENRMCFVEGCKRKANTIEHLKGRKGFADEQARKENIPLLLDERFWKPCCLQHNLEFETNPELSKKYQQSQIHKGKKI
jgi:hypothetical protein